MKKVVLLIALVAVTLITLLNTGATSNKKAGASKKPNQIMGTWQLSLYKYGSGTTDFTEASPNAGRIKLITDTHFTWVHFDKSTNIIHSSAGGTYSLEGNTYTESIDYGLAMDSYLGNKPVYNIKVEGDNLFLTGELVSGYKIEEVWQRIKPSDESRNTKK
jgi:hypothetical protein